MADEKNILQLNEGVPIEDPTGGFLYIVVDGQDYPISYEDLVKFVLSSDKYRAAQNVTITAGSNEILFQKDAAATPMASDSYALIIQPLGDVTLDTENIIKTINGFTVEALNSGNIDYIAMQIT